MLPCVGVLALVAPFVALAVALGLRARVRNLEADVRALRQRLHGADAAPAHGQPGGAAVAPAPLAPQAPAAAAAPVTPPRAAPQGPIAPAAAPAPLRPPFDPDARPARARGPRGAGTFSEASLVRLFVWVGGIALVLGAGFLMRHAYEQGLLRPEVRLVLGSLAGLASIGGGEFLRRRSDRVAQALVAAGVAVLFTVLFVATQVERVLAPATGFALLALVTAGAVALSLRFGVFVALLGLCGGFLTPALVRMGEPRPGLLFAYLLCLQVGLQVVGQRRGWTLLAILNAAGCLLWAATWVIAVGERGALPGDRLPLAGFLVASLISFAVTRLPHPLLWFVAAAVFTILGALLRAAGFSDLEWGTLGLLVLAAVALARLRRGLEVLAGLAAVAVVGLLIAWHVHRTGAPHATDQRFALVSLCLGSLLAAAPMAAQIGAVRPAGFVAVSVAGALAVLGLAWWSLGDPPRVGPPWWVAGLGVAAAYSAAGSVLVARRATLAQGEVRATAVVVAVTAGASFALATAAPRALVPAGSAVEIVALAAGARVLRLDPLRVLAAALVGVVAAWLGVDPAGWREAIGATPLANALWTALGVPALACGLGAAILLRTRDDGCVAVLEVTAALATTLLALAQVHHAIHGGLRLAGPLRFTELGILCAVAACCAAAALWLGCARGRPRLVATAQGVLALCAVVALPGLLLLCNPVFAPVAVGSRPVFNLLLVGYGLPCVAFVQAAVAARGLSGALGRVTAIGSGVVALVLLFALVNLEVRQGFHGSILHGGAWTTAESYSYSAAWAGLGLVLLLPGVLLRSGAAVLRWASLAVLLLAIGKAFLVDASALTGLYRVFSFLGLGAALLGLGLVYQRFVFRGATADAAE
ncbi:MAG: DUF2339 domain-containing protein [Planctomycetes bacterium]|nr:DUF2339 domain-containing protein [Planctomycetota bacterium]